MRYSINICAICILIVLFTSFLNGENKPADEICVGKIDFIDKNGLECIVIQTSAEKKIFLNKNMLLLIKRANEAIILKIIDIDGKYIRCAIKDNNREFEIKHNDYVYYSERLNNNIKYADAGKILAELIKLYENFILKVESTEDTRLLSEEVIKFSRDLDKLIPEIKRIYIKYPELKQFNISPPQELKNESGILRMIEPRLRDAFFKIKMYTSDEKVKKAADELQKVLKKMADE